MPWSVTIAGSMPPLTSRRNSRSEMLRTTCTCTQEWSDMPRRSDWICAMYHQERTRSSALTASRNRSNLRLPRVGACTCALATCSEIEPARTSGPCDSIPPPILSGDDQGGFMAGSHLRGFGLFAGIPTADVVTVISLRLKELG